MAVHWRPLAVEDRAGYWRALNLLNPAAADRQDAAIAAEGNALDGAATYCEGPLPGTRLYTCRSGRHVIIYTRQAAQVTIDRVRATRSQWNPGD